jgi:hypothetical protein
MTGGGTASTVTRWRSTSVSSSPTSKRGIVTTRAPASSGAASVTTKPITWQNGASASTVSRAVSPSRSSTWRAPARRLRWLSSTPFGSPVVPLE